MTVWLTPEEFLDYLFAKPQQRFDDFYEIRKIAETDSLAIFIDERMLDFFFRHG